MIFWGLVAFIALAHFIFVPANEIDVFIYLAFLLFMVVALFLIIELHKKIKAGINKTFEILDESVKNKELLSKLFNHSPDAIILYNNDGEIIRANSSAINLTSFSNEELIKRTIFDLFEDCDDLLRETSEYFSINGKETFVLTKNGSKKRVLIKAHKIANEEGLFQLVFIDITERYEMRERIIEYNNLKRMASEIAHFGGCKFIPEENRIIVTDQTIEMLGLPEKEKITFSDWLNLIEDEDRRGLELRLEMLEKNHDRFIVDYQLKNKNGKNRIFIRQICELEINEEGQRIIWGAVLDITEIQRQKELLINSEKKYRTIVELAPIGLTTLDITDSYKILKNMFSSEVFSKEQLLNLNYSEVRELLDNFIIVESNNQNMTQFGSFHSEEVRAYTLKDFELDEPIEKIAEIIYNIFMTDSIVKTNLKVKNLLTNTTSILDIRIRKSFSDGKIFLVVASQDITELITAKNKLASTNKLLYNFLDAIPFIVVTLNKEGYVIFINKKGAEIIGEPIDEIIGKNWFENYLETKDAQYLNKMFVKVMNSENPYFPEKVNPIKTKKGKPIIYWYNEVILDENGKAMGTLSLGVDITDEKRKKKELNKSHKELILLKHELEKQNRKLRIARNQLAESERQLKNELLDKDKMFSLIAHDMRSPFTGLLSGLQFIAEMYDEMSDEEKKTLIQNAFHASRRIYNLLEELLEWSRLRLGKFKISPEVIKLNNVVDSVLELFENDSKRKNIELINGVAENECLFIDKQFIHGILRNLISNSLKFTPDNGSIAVKSTNHKDGFYEIDIIDTGVGVPEEIIKKFSGEEIKNIESSEGTRREKGFGLGLMLVKELVEKINGHIYIENRKEGGTKVMVFIPRDKVVDCNKN